MQPPHDELQEEQSRLRCLPVLREVGLNALLFLTAERRIGEDDIHPVPLANLGQAEAKRVAGVDVGSVETMQQQVHLSEEVGKRLGLPPEEGLGLKTVRSSTVFTWCAEMVVRFDQEATGAARRVKYRLAQSGVGRPPP